MRGLARRGARRVVARAGGSVARRVPRLGALGAESAYARGRAERRACAHVGRPSGVDAGQVGGTAHGRLRGVAGACGRKGVRGGASGKKERKEGREGRKERKGKRVKGKEKENRKERKWRKRK